jgi:hypothetical protein
VARNKYRLLLAALILLLVGYPVLRGARDVRLVFDFLLTVVFLAALAVVYADRRLRVLTVLLGFPTVLGVWVGYALPGVPARPLEVGLHLSAAVFFALTVAAILRGVYRDPVVSADSVYGAFCGYLLAGLAFGHVYCLVETLSPGSFTGGADIADRLRDRDEQHFLLTYFSLTTITTAGFGDVTPAKDPARALAMVEAITGQFYIAVLIAELIGKRLSQVPPPAGTPSAPSGFRV